MRHSFVSPPFLYVFALLELVRLPEFIVKSIIQKSRVRFQNTYLSVATIHNLVRHLFDMRLDNLRLVLIFETECLVLHNLFLFFFERFVGGALLLLLWRHASDRLTVGENLFLFQEVSGTNL